MNRLIKALPLMAVILGLTVFLGNAASKAIAQNTATDQEWMFSGSGSPDDPSNYTAAPAGTRNDCQEEEEAVCVVIAPADPANSNQTPAFSPELEQALASDLNNSNIIKGPYTP